MSTCNGNDTSHSFSCSFTVACSDRIHCSDRIQRHRSLMPYISSEYTLFAYVIFVTLG